MRETHHHLRAGQIWCVSRAPRGWSVRRLRQEIHNATGLKRSRGGRKPKRPKRQSAGVALQNISSMSRDWMRNHEVWFEEPGCFSGRIRKRDRNAILREAESTIKRMKQVHEAAGDGLEQLRAFVRELEEMLST